MRERDVSDVPELDRPNMTPMIDVVFQLIVFFIATMKFRSLDEKIETSLAHAGVRADHAPPEPPTLTVLLRRPVDGAPTRLVVDGRELGSLDAADRPATRERLRRHCESVRRRASDLGAGTVRCELDASPRVATLHVIGTLDVLGASGIEDVRFRGTPPLR